MTVKERVFYQYIQLRIIQVLSIFFSSKKLQVQFKSNLKSVLLEIESKVHNYFNILFKLNSFYVELAEGVDFYLPFLKTLNLD